MRLLGRSVRLSDLPHLNEPMGEITVAATEIEWLRYGIMHFHPFRTPDGHHRSPLAFTGYVNLAGVALLVVGLLLMA
jgi:hypothetical protein